MLTPRLNWQQIFIALLCVQLFSCKKIVNLRSPKAPSSDATCKKDAALKLYPQTANLWPKKDGKVTIKVCWDKPQFKTVYPLAQYAPDISASLATSKKYVEEIVASQWTKLTSIEFTGWQDCSAGEADFHIVPIDSAASFCNAKGQSCVEAFGKKMLGKNLYLNVMFGEEFLYASRYLHAHPDDYQAEKDVKSWFIPAACFEDLRYPWAENNRSPDPSTKVNIDDPKVFARYQSIFSSCLQHLALHEIGHVLGFAHEQYREDDAAAQEACRKKIEAKGSSDDIGNIPEEFLGDVTIGPFDPESIMSYCRENPAPTLTDVDVEMTRQVYEITDPEDPVDPKLPPPGKPEDTPELTENCDP
jgi:hypothetical protein